MKKVVTGISLIFSRADSRLVVIVATALLALSIFVVQNGDGVIQVLEFESLSLSTRLMLATSTLFAISGSFTTTSLLLMVFGSFLGAINVSLAYTYVRMRGEVILSSGLYSGIGLLFAFLGIGCAACGTAFVAVFFSFFGISGVLQMLPYHGQEIGYIGLLVLSLSTYVLAQKVMAPNVC